MSSLKYLQHCNLYIYVIMFVGGGYSEEPLLGSKHLSVYT